ncbi:unnamed protein product, partial [Tenebrio molitor]
SRRKIFDTRGKSRRDQDATGFFFFVETRSVERGRGKPRPVLHVVPLRKMRRGNCSSYQKLMTTKRFDFGAAMVEKNVTFAFGGFGDFLGEEILNSTAKSTFVGSLEQVLVLPPRRLRPKWKEFFRFHTSTFSLLVLTVLAYALLTRLRTRM